MIKKGDKINWNEIIGTVETIENDWITAYSKMKCYPEFRWYFTTNILNVKKVEKKGNEIENKNNK
jgi:hypothetical protein